MQDLDPKARYSRSAMAREEEGLGVSHDRPREEEGAGVRCPVPDACAPVPEVVTMAKGGGVAIVAIRPQGGGEGSEIPYFP